MHWELKALLRAGWSFGLHWDAAADCFTAVARKGESVARNSSAIEPGEAMARVMIDAQVMEANIR